jgi:hypothetical protein
MYHPNSPHSHNRLPDLSLHRVELRVVVSLVRLISRLWVDHRGLGKIIYRNKEKRMKVFLIAFALFLVSGFVQAADYTGYTVITSTGPNTITYNKKMNEVFIVNKGTNTLHVNFISSLVSDTTNYFTMDSGIAGETFRLDINTFQLGIYVSNNGITPEVRVFSRGTTEIFK